MDSRILVVVFGALLAVGWVESESCNKADVAFLLDESASIQPIPFSEIKQFVYDVMDALKVASGESHASVVFFSDRAQFLFRFDMITRSTVELEDLKTLIGRRVQRGGSTHTYRGLDLIKRVAFTTSYGARQRNDIARICIVITDGNSQLTNRTRDSARKLRDDAKVHVFAIGVGNETQIRQAELKNIASNDQSIFRVKDASGLSKITGAVSGAACKVLEEEKEEEEELIEVPDEELDPDWVPEEEDES